MGKPTSDLTAFTAARRLKERPVIISSRISAATGSDEPVAPPSSNVEGRVVDGVKTFGSPTESEKRARQGKK